MKLQTKKCKIKFLKEKYTVCRGPIELENVIDLVGNESVREEMIKWVKHFSNNEETYHWHEIEPNSTVPIERIAIMKLLKYGVLNLGKVSC